MNHSAATGYMIVAAKKVGLPEKEIKGLEREMQRQLDMKTACEAEETYRKF